MFNLFKKKKTEAKKNEINPSKDSLESLSENQRMSVINLLLMMLLVDGEPNNPDNGMQYINNYIKRLGVRYDSCNNYLKQNKTALDLKTISLKQKELIFTALWEIMKISGRPSQSAFKLFVDSFALLGITDENYIKEFGERLRKS